MSKFKVGDRVRRIAGGKNGNMKEGDIGTIIFIDTSNNTLEFKEYSSKKLAFAKSYFELVSSIDSQSKQIVYEVY
jgi:transcription elongation factor